MGATLARKRLRIGIDGGSLSNKRGFGRFARELVDALAALRSEHEIVVIIDEPSLRHGITRIPTELELVSVPVSESPSCAAAAAGRRRLGDMLAMGRAASKAHLDAMYFPSTYSYFPVLGAGPVVVTVFDTLPLDFPELVFPRRAGRWAWTLKERVAVAQADRIVTTSEYSKRSIIRHYGGSANRIDVVPCAPSSVFQPIADNERVAAVSARYGIANRNRFLLYVGGLSPHKNLIRLIDAFADLGKSDLQLVLVGDFKDVFHTHVPELRAAVARRGVEARVIFAGFVPDDELVCLYNAAVAVVQPSLVEGFGLPPVEAMACGTPVIASSAGSLPEVVADAGLMFNPRSIAEISSAIKAITTDDNLRDRLAAKALTRATMFTWSNAAASVLSAIEKTAYRRRKFAG